MSTKGPTEGKPMLTTSLKQTQRLIMSPQMQQAIQLLQVPALEMATLIEQEMEQNPLLEYESELDEDQEEAEREEEEIAEKVNEEEAVEQDEQLNGEALDGLEMNFEDDNFSLVQELEEEFGDHWEQSGQAYGLNKRDSDKLQTFLESSIRS